MNFSKAKSRVISDNLNINEIKDICVDMIMENWIHSKNIYFNDFVKIDGTMTPDFYFDFNNVLAMEQMLKYFSYVSFIYERIEKFLNMKIKLLEIKNELIYVEQKGIACIYTSVLLYLLMKKYNSQFTQKNVCFMYGFYQYEINTTPDNFFSLFPFSKKQQGLHCFLSIDSCLFDCSLAKQESCLFNFESELFGDTPAGLNIYGYAESEETIYKYAELFADVNKQSIDEWINYHNKFIEVLV